MGKKNKQNKAKQQEGQLGAVKPEPSSSERDQEFSDTDPSQMSATQTPMEQKSPTTLTTSIQLDQKESTAKSETVKQGGAVQPSIPQKKIEELVSPGRPVQRSSLGGAVKNASPVPLNKQPTQKVTQPEEQKLSEMLSSPQATDNADQDDLIFNVQEETAAVKNAPIKNQGETQKSPVAKVVTPPAATGTQQQQPVKPAQPPAQVASPQPKSPSPQPAVTQKQPTPPRPAQPQVKAPVAQPKPQVPAPQPTQTAKQPSRIQSSQEAQRHPQAGVTNQRDTDQMQPTGQNKPLSKHKKQGSKFDLQGSDTKLYRPEFQDKSTKKGQEKMWELMSTYLPTGKEDIQKQIVNHVEYTLARTRFNFDNFGAYQAAALAARDRLIESWNDTQAFHKNQDVKRVYYLSLEFLMGRTFQNALVNIDMEQKFKEALMDMGYNLEELYEQETDAALGNGGLGRLAACFIDSLATLEIPAWGYGIRYDYGIFKQQIKDGYQVEIPDFWLNHGNPWEIERKDVTYQIRFYGHSQKYQDGNTERAKWEGCQKVLAMAYDTPIPGFNTYNTNNLRLWRSCPRTNFDFDRFNSSDYSGAIAERQQAEYITSVLYPNDSTDAGKELRLKQQYFFCSASIYDMIRRYKEKHNDRFALFADKNRVQLNDTHPAIATIELLRILIDEEMLSFEEAWGVIYNTFSYTNHTVLPEALEKWSVDLIGRLLPRHLELIYLINHIYLEKLRQKYPGDNKKVERMSLIEEGYPKKVRMAYLSIVCSHTVNGVAQLHTDLLKATIFSEFDQLYPGKIQNKTNGVTPRRWIHCCNPALSDLLTDALGSVDEWITSLENLQQLVPFATDAKFQTAFANIKRENKKKLAAWVKEHTGFDIPIDSLYDIQVKRIHEYKRQLMNILYVIHRYLTILDTPQHERARKFQPRVVMIGGKAAPGYYNAKAFIKLITAVSYKINNDHNVGDLLKVIFLPNYNVSAAQVIIPAAELSQHISTAGTEASGTSNMKFVMNGCLIIGTMDGANVEIAEEIGEENMFIFGERVDGVNRIRKEMWQGKRDYVGGRLQRVFDTIKSGFFGDTHVVHPILDQLADGGDHYITCFDFYSYIDAQERVDATYRDQRKWNEMAIIGVAKSGKFSSDRTIAQYCGEIWDTQPVTVPSPSTTAAARTRSSPNLLD